ncbi:hypothetical protein HHK36_017130 [Tetracentron sinense]|uniref:TFIIS N-terminal domain-containing protein n=1 Tax=Tetracentron sinense TaxID=13715 RepID=A0A834YYX6_TETSI|nr:hypothetical protein HHK36_017130 [Tetracentron sinense]
MASKSGALDYWRNYFRTASTDIFEVIEYAIIVAASDCSKEFRMKRDRIAESLFSCRMTRCFGCDRVELVIPEEEEEEEEEGDGDFKNCFNGNGDDFEGGVSKESKENSSPDDHAEMKLNRVSNYSYDEAEALTEEIEEENQIVGEVLRIKGILSNIEDESDAVLFESLRRLQLMELSVETLKATEIGKAVNGFRKHGSKQIRHLARTLIEYEISGFCFSCCSYFLLPCLFSTEIVNRDQHHTRELLGAEGSPDSVNPSVVDEEEGLPSPPMDEGAFFATTTSIELSQFFDGMDDDGNPRNIGEFDKNHENGRKPTMENHNIPKWKQQSLNEANELTKGNKGQEIKKQEVVIKRAKTSNTDSGPGRPPKISSEHKINNETKFHQKPNNATLQKRPLATQVDKSRCSDEFSVRVKLEASKRKLHEGYQQAENAKKQRTIQVMELHDLPKQGLGHRNPHVRSGNHNRNWANGRR